MNQEEDLVADLCHFELPDSLEGCYLQLWDFTTAMRNHDGGDHLLCIRSFVGNSTSMASCHAVEDGWAIPAFRYVERLHIQFGRCIARSGVLTPQPCIGSRATIKSSIH